MASIHPLTKDACVVAVGATQRYSFRRGALEMLLDPEPGVTTRRVPLMKGREREMGDLTLSKARRTLLVRVHDPPRLYVCGVDNARAFLRGEVGALPLTEATDNETGAPPAPRPKPAAARAPPMPAERATRAAPAAPAAAPLATGSHDSYDSVVAGIHACPIGLTCRPGRGTLYPAAPMGRSGAEGPDVLLVGWNPRPERFARTTMPDLAAWCADFENGLQKAAAAKDPWAVRLQEALPQGYRLDDARVMATWLWKWPTRIKGGEGNAQFYAGRCIRDHFLAELAALRPRLVVAYETEASEWFAKQAEQRGLELREPPAQVRNREMWAWSPPSAAWGWPMGLVLLRDADAARFRDITGRWARKAGERVLSEASAL